MPIPSFPRPDVPASGGIHFPLGESVAIVTAGSTTDPYSGQPSDSWDDEAVTTVEVTGVAVEPRPSQEPVQDARNAVTSGYTLYFPPGTEITPSNRVVVRGETYEVLGEPAVWRSPFTGWTPGIVVQVERTEG